MARYHQLAGGGKQKFTAEEEKIKDAEEKARLDGKAERHLLKLRSVRNELLAETDYMALGDVTMSDAMKTYREELRDITEGLTTAEEVEAVVFPTKPGA